MSQRYYVSRFVVFLFEQYNISSYIQRGQILIRQYITLIQIIFKFCIIYLNTRFPLPHSRVTVCGIQRKAALFNYGFDSQMSKIDRHNMQVHKKYIQMLNICKTYSFFQGILLKSNNIQNSHSGERKFENLIFESGQRKCLFKILPSHISSMCGIQREARFYFFLLFSNFSLLCNK